MRSDPDVAPRATQLARVFARLGFRERIEQATRDELREFALAITNYEWEPETNSIQ